MKQNSEKITPELIQRTRLVFYPKTQQEAVLVQQKLFAMGAVWSGNEGIQQVQYVTESVREGLISKNGKIFHSPNNDDENMRADISQFDPAYLTPEQSFQQDQFNKIAARIEQLATRLEQVAAKVDKVHDEMFPAVADTKPKLKPSGVN